MSSSSEDRVQHLCQLLSRNDPTVTEIYLRYERIGDGGATAIAATLANNRYLESIIMRNCGIRDSGIAAIANGLERNTSVTELDLAGNRLGEAGATAMSRMLAVNQTLTSLSLMNMKIEDSQAILLSRGLQNRNSQLRTLRLSNNMIGNDGAMAFGNALQSNQWLTSISFFGNLIGDDDGAIGLENALPDNSSIQTASPANNHVDIEEVRGVFATKLEANMTLRHVFCPHCTNSLVDLYLSLNRAGRQLLKVDNAHPCLWAYILAKAGRRYALGPSMIYYFLREKPSLCSFLQATRKRKRV